MTREDKIKKKKERSKKRYRKKQIELDSIHNRMSVLDNISFSRARTQVRRRYAPFKCEMGYGDCEERGYCNGDC